MQDQTDAGKGSVLVLVVESDPYLRALRQTLLGERYSVYFVADAEVALEAARRLRPRLLIDSLGDLEAASADPQRFRSYVYSLIQLFAVRGVTAYVTYEVLVDPDFAAFTRMGASYISDNVIALRYFVESSAHLHARVTRVLAVVKCRGGAHDNYVRQTIGRRGVELEGAPPGADR